MKRTSAFPKISAIAHYHDENTVKISYSVYDETGWVCVNTVQIYLDKDSAKKLLTTLSHALEVLDGVK